MAIERFKINGEMGYPTQATPERMNLLVDQANNELSNLSTEVTTSLATKVDKITGKGLSTNDYTDIEKAEVAKVVDKADKTTVNSNYITLDTKINSQASGSPKGTYATISALTTAFPSGNTNIYVVTADGKWYYWNGTIWTAGGVYQSTGIAPNSVGVDETKYLMAEGVPSKNLFNKTTVTYDKYVNYTTGNNEALSGWSASDFIAVMPSTMYAISKNSNVHDVSFYTSSKVFISGIDKSYGFFTTPANCYYVRLTTLTSDLDLQQLEKGDVKTFYANLNPQPNVKAFRKHNTLIVAKSGGDYTTITEAMLNAEDTASNPITILVMPGVYKESVKMQNHLHLSIVGVNKYTCVLRMDKGDYYNPPLQISGNAYIANMTIISTEDDLDPNRTLSAYCIHADYAGAGTMEIHNCILKSSSNFCFGLGTHDQQTFIINNCITESASGTIYAHNKPQNGATNQKFIFKNNIFKSDNDKLFYLFDSNHSTGGGYGDAMDTTLTCYNNMFYSNVNGKSNILVFDAPLGEGIAGYIKLTGDSYGNNINVLNK